MGNCFKPIEPNVDISTDAEGNMCCDDNKCPSSCCVIVVRKASSPGRTSPTDSSNSRKLPR